MTINNSTRVVCHETAPIARITDDFSIEKKTDKTSTTAIWKATEKKLVKIVTTTLQASLKEVEPNETICWRLFVIASCAISVADPHSSIHVTTFSLTKSGNDELRIRLSSHSRWIVLCTSATFSISKPHRSIAWVMINGTTSNTHESKNTTKVKYDSAIPHPLPILFQKKRIIFSNAIAIIKAAPIKKMRFEAK